MLYFSKWKALGTLLTAFIVCLFAVPNFFSDATIRRAARLGAAARRARARPAGRLAHPARGRRQLRAQGEGRTTARRCAPRAARESRVGYTGLVVRGLTVEVRIREESNFDTALSKLRELAQPLGGLLSATGQRSLDVVDAGNRLIQLTITQPAITERIRQAVEQSIQIVERRVNELGTVEPLIQRQGIDRILVQVPGLSDPARLLQILGKTAKLTFRMVDTTDSVAAGIARPGPARGRPALRAAERRQAGLSDREARHGVGRRPDRRAAGFRPAHQRADRLVQVQHQRRAPLRTSHAGERRSPVRDRARQRGDLRAGDPRADPRRIGADLRQFHRAGRQRSRDPVARRRTASAAHRDRAARGRRRSRTGLDPKGSARFLFRRRCWSWCSCW